eukprot:747250-Hanusia_phi.AAC.1
MQPDEIGSAIARHATESTSVVSDSVTSFIFACIARQLGGNPRKHLNHLESVTMLASPRDPVQLYKSS